MKRTNQLGGDIIIDDKTKIYINKRGFNILKKYNGAWRIVLSYYDLESFLKMLPGNIIKNSDDIKTIKDIHNKLNYYLEEIVPKIIKSQRK